MCERVKKCSSLCKVAGTRDWNSRLASCQWCTWVKHAEKMNSHASWSTTGQKAQSGNSVCLRLSQVVRPSHQPALFWKTWLFAFHSHSSINTPHTHEILRASRENIERETLEKNKIDSSTIFTQTLFKFLYSHRLHCYILERFITKTFSHHFHICEKAI